MVRGAAPGDPPPVVLVGGSAGTDTLAVATRLARELGVLLLRSDAYWHALREVTSREQYPALHLLPEIETGEAIPTGELLDRFVEAAQLVCDALEPPLRFQAHAGPGLVVEGAWLLPSLAAKLAVTASERADVGTVFLFENDPGELERAMLREGGDTGSSERQQRLAAVSYEYGLWLHGECARLGIPAVDSRPGATIAARVRATLGLPGARPAEMRG